MLLHRAVTTHISAGWLQSQGIPLFYVKPRALFIKVLCCQQSQRQREEGRKRQLRQRRQFYQGRPLRANREGWGAALGSHWEPSLQDMRNTFLAMTVCGVTALATQWGLWRGVSVNSPEGRVGERVWGQVAGVVVGSGSGRVQAERR